MDVQTSRLHIRDVVMADLEAMVDLWCDPDVDHWMRGFGPRGRAAVEQWLPMTIAFNEAESRESHNCAIVLREASECVGWIGFGPNGQARPVMEVNFGYAIRAAFRGCGYGTEAIRAAIEFCHTVLGVPTFRGETRVGNDASARAMEKAGMRRTGEVVDEQVQFCHVAV